jgi:hypothetical protein
MGEKVLAHTFDLLMRDEEDTKMNKGVTLAIGLAAGARLMYLLDPDRGKRRRALLRDKVKHGVHKASDAIETAAFDLSHRASGLVAETRSRLRKEEVSDPVLVDRVRSKIGRVVSHPRAIEVTADQGRVTLSGPILAGEVNDLLSTVAAVRGVASVENRLEVHQEAGDVPALQGERRGRPAAHGSPTARLMTGTAGGALAAYGAKRGDAMGAALGVVGLGLLARGLTTLLQSQREMTDFVAERATANNKARQPQG